MEDAVLNHSVFSKNRDQLFTSEIAKQFFAEVKKHAKRLMNDKHFSTDGTLTQAWAPQKSSHQKDDAVDADEACDTEDLAAPGR